MPAKFEKLENLIEDFIFRSRWFLAPIYIGLALALILLPIKFGQEMIHIVPGVIASSETDLVLAVLSLVDMALVANLVLMVVFAGYENFVSKIDVGDHPDRPPWMGKVGMSGLKIRLIASIVAISSIQLLKQFMYIKNISDRDLAWMVGIHLTFVVSGVLLALIDRIVGEH